MRTGSHHTSSTHHATAVRLSALLLVAVFLFAQFPYCGCIDEAVSHVSHGLILTGLDSDCCSGEGETEACGNDCHCDICNRGGGSFVLVYCEAGTATHAVPIPACLVDCPVSIILPVSTLPPRHA